MKIGGRGQATIPKPLRERFGLASGEEVEFHVVNDQLVLKKATPRLNLDKWRGYCHDSFAELGYEASTISLRTSEADDNGHRHKRLVGYSPAQ